MNRLVLFLSVAIIGGSAAAAPLQDRVEIDPISRSPLTAGRSPASVNALLDFHSVDSQRPGVSILQAAQEPNPRWRLMGTCRQDIGMQRNQNGIGYGDCRD
jgi:hypothetical protein